MTIYLVLQSTFFLLSSFFNSELIFDCLPQVEMQKQLANSFEDELIRAKQELDEAQEQISNLDKKYSKAKKLIKEFQQR